MPLVSEGIKTVLMGALIVICFGVSLTADVFHRILSVMFACCRVPDAVSRWVAMSFAIGLCVVSCTCLIIRWVTLLTAANAADHPALVRASFSAFSISVSFQSDLRVLLPAVVKLGFIYCCAFVFVSFRACKR